MKTHINSFETSASYSTAAVTDIVEVAHCLHDPYPLYSKDLHTTLNVFKKCPHLLAFYYPWGPKGKGEY